MLNPYVRKDESLGVNVAAMIESPVACLELVTVLSGDQHMQVHGLPRWALRLRLANVVPLVMQYVV